MGWKDYNIIYNLLFTLSVAFISLCIGVAVTHHNTKFSRDVISIIEYAKQEILFKAEITADKTEQVENYELTSDELLRSLKIKSSNPTADNEYKLISIFATSDVYLINRKGQITAKWNMPFSKVWTNATHVQNSKNATPYIRAAKLYPNGDLLLLYEGLGDTPYGYGLAKIDKNSNVIWKYSDNIHHDIYIDNESGNIYTLSQSFIKSGPKGAEGLYMPQLTDYAVILSPDGNLLEKIPLLDAFINSKYKPYLTQKKQHSKNESWDALHANSIMRLSKAQAPKFPQFKEGDILISFRNMNLIAVLDPLNKTIKWAARGPWANQHDAKFLDNGNIMLFDNAGYVENYKQVFSRVLEFNPMTLAIEWEYHGTINKPLYTYLFGHAQRLENETTVIVESGGGRAIEVTKEGNIVWEILVDIKGKNKLNNNTLFVMEKIPANYLHFLAADANVTSSEP